MDPYGGRQKGWPNFSWVIPGVISYLPNYNLNKNEYKMKRNLGSQKHPYKRHHKNQQKQNFILGSKRKNLNPPKPDSPPVDPEEEERKKKLTDTANKLLCKLKSWSAEGTESESSSKAESNPKPNEGKPKRIAHSKNFKKSGRKPVAKKKEGKKNKKTSVNSEKYDVNKATVKNFQNRIQHKLINEIMKMPKESLQNVLNDPKINPIMELKMSRLVRENKLLIAQRLRAIAEAKMSSKDIASSSQLLADIDKLIDPVIEADLSVLPCQLIEQMENIFQVQFDHSNGQASSSQETEESSMAEALVDEELEDSRVYECSTDEDEEESKVTLNDSSFELDEAAEAPKEEIYILDEINKNKTKKSSTGEQFIKQESEQNENMVSYCSVEPEYKFIPPSNCATNFNSQSQEQTGAQNSDSQCSNGISVHIESPIKIQNNHFGTSFTEPMCLENSYSSSVPELDLNQHSAVRQLNFSSTSVSQEDSIQKSPKQYFSTKPPSENLRSPQNYEKNIVCASTEPIRHFEAFSQPSPTQSPVKNSHVCDKELPSENSRMQLLASPQSKTNETQTDSVVPEFLYGVPVPKEATDESPASLLQEVESIQHLIAKLNERRFRIFLLLAQSNQSGNFLNSQSLCNNFAESLANGSFSLFESLKKFFT